MGSDNRTYSSRKENVNSLFKLSSADSWSVRLKMAPPTSCTNSMTLGFLDWKSIGSDSGVISSYQSKPKGTDNYTNPFN